MTQTHQGVLSTKRKTTPSNPARSVSPLSSDILAKISNKLYVVVEPIRKIYTDGMGQFPIHSHYGYHYIMLKLHCNINIILI